MVEHIISRFNGQKFSDVWSYDIRDLFILVIIMCDEREFPVRIEIYNILCGIPGGNGWNIIECIFGEYMVDIIMKHCCGTIWSYIISDLYREYSGE